MSFEPDADKCEHPITGDMCPGYVQGDGDDTISRCIPEERPDQVKPPWWCKEHTDGIADEENPTESV